MYALTIIILVVVVVSFVGAPIVSRLGGGGRLVFGRYGREDIEYVPGNFFARQYDVIAQQLRDSGAASDVELQLRLAWREAFDQTVLHTAVLTAAADSSMTVSEAYVDRAIAQAPQFQVGGRFDSGAYGSLSQQERFSLRRFYRETAIFDQFVADVIGEPRPSSGERAFVAAMAGPERSFEVARFDFGSFPESQVAQFAQDNPDLFAELDLAVITMPSEDEAHEVRDQALEPGAQFGDLARTFSRDLSADQDGAVGVSLGHEIARELRNEEAIAELAALERDEISTVIETTSGWAFYRALSEPVPFDADEDGALEDVRTYMEIYEQGLVQDYVRDDAERFVETARRDGFRDAVGERGLTVIETPFFPVNYGNQPYFGQVGSPEIPDLADASFREEFFEVAFGLDEGDVSAPIVLRQSVIVLRLREERAAETSDVEFLSNFYEAIVQQFHSEVAEEVLVEDELLEDNFVAAFNRYVMGQ